MQRAVELSKIDKHHYPLSGDISERIIQIVNINAKR